MATNESAQTADVLAELQEELSGWKEEEASCTETMRACEAALARRHGWDEQKRACIDIDWANAERARRDARKEIRDIESRISACVAKS